MVGSAAQSIFFTAVIGLSVFPNALIITVFGCSRRHLQLSDSYLVSLAIADLSRALVGHGLDVYTLLSRTSLSSHALSCNASGFIITFLALVSITHILYLALERYVTIVYPFFSEKIKCCRSWLRCSLAFIWIYGLIWASLPLLGWCSYRLESSGKLCSIDWQDKSVSGKGYILSLFAFCYVMPGIAMLVSFMAVKRELRNMRKRAAQLFGRDHTTSKAIRPAELKHAKMVFIMAIAFIAAWTPYAVVTFLLTFGLEVPKTLLLCSAYLGKTSAFYNPIIYAFYCENFRKAVRRLFRKKTTYKGPNRNRSTMSQRSSSNNLKNGKMEIQFKTFLPVTYIV